MASEASRREGTTGAGFLRLPVNAPFSLVLVTRPCTLVFNLILITFTTIASLIFNVLHIPPPQCFLCRDQEGRTRPRPRPVKREEAQGAPTASTSSWKQLGEHIKSGISFGLSATPRRPSRRVLSPIAKISRATNYQPHELDNVYEEDGFNEEEDDLPAEEDDDHLTPDQGESDSEPSEVDTVADSPVESFATARKGGKEGKRGFFSRKPKREASTDDDDSTKTGGSGGSKTSTPTSILSKKSAIEALCPLHRRSSRRGKSSRPAETSPTRPPLLSTNSDPNPHPHAYVAELDTYRRPCLSRSSTSSAEHAPPSLDSATSTVSSLSLATPPPTLAARPAPKRISTSPTFSFKHPFRSLSPLSRSPVTSPKPSPPTSPRLAAQERRELVVPNLRIGRARGRSEVDSTGFSSLSMGDLLKS